MKAKEVMKLLNICRTTLYHYTKNNIIKHTKLSNGYYDYDEHSVLQFIKKDNRSNVIYARVSTYKQKNDLTNQINKLQTYCDNNKINIQHVYSEIASGIDLDRTELSKLLDDIFTHKIKNIYISNKDRLTRLSFKTLESLLKVYNTFDENWEYLWIGQYHQKYNKEKHFANSKYNTHIDKIKELIGSSSTNWEEPEWEFPKGRLHIGEDMLSGALREFTEETNIPQSDIRIIGNLYPFNEEYISSNDKIYKNTYYLAKYISTTDCNLSNFQIEEVSKMEWMDESECISNIRPYNTEKKILIRNINNALHRYFVIS